MFINRLRLGLKLPPVRKVVNVAEKGVETTNGSGPEAELFTFSKMAAGMYLEHYLDSKIAIVCGEMCGENTFSSPRLSSLVLLCALACRMSAS